MTPLPTPPTPPPRPSQPWPPPSSRAWPPRPSPYTDFDNYADDEPRLVTGVHPATREYTRHVAWLTVAKSVGLMLLAVAGGSIAAWRTVISEATREAKESAAVGISTLDTKASATQRELERFQSEVEKRLDRSDAQGDRVEKKFDVLLDRLNVRNPAPAPKEVSP